MLGAAALYIANAAAGKPNIMNGNLPAMKAVVLFTIVPIVDAEAPTNAPILDNCTKYAVLAPAIVVNVPTEPFRRT